MLNRAVGWQRIFKTEGEFAAFEAVLGEAVERAGENMSARSRNAYRDSAVRFVAIRNSPRTVYTDPKLLDVAGSLDALSQLLLSPLDDSPNRDRAKATGTDPDLLVPMLVPNAGNHGDLLTITDHR